MTKNTRTTVRIVWANGVVTTGNMRTAEAAERVIAHMRTHPHAVHARIIR